MNDKYIKCNDYNNYRIHHRVLMSKYITAILLIFTLGSCGFEAVHKKGDGRAELALGEVSYSGYQGLKMQQYLTSQMMHKLGGDAGGQSYSIDISASSSKSSVAVQQSGRPTRYNLKLVADVSIKKNGKNVAQYSLRKVSGYEASSSEYASFAAHERTERLLIEELAREIYERAVIEVRR